MIKLYEPKIYEEDIELVNKTLKNRWISGNSPIVQEFEEKLRNFCDTKFCLLTSSGTTALHLALLGCDLKEGDEVIMPSLSYIATANAVKYFGGKPVFIDINEDDFMINTNKIKESITSKTKAILPVHLYGNVPNLEKIEEISNHNDLAIIHDSAEALGSLYRNKQSVSFKDVGILSFFPNKIITTGEGGAIVTDNEDIYNLCKKLRSQGLIENTDYMHDVVGYNYRISALNAALGFNQIDKIESHRKTKSEIFNFYSDQLSEHGVRFQQSNKDSVSSHWLSVGIFTEEIDIEKLQIHLKKNNIETRRVFYPLHLQEPYREKKVMRLNSSEKIYNSGLCLPTYPDLSPKDQQYIVDKILEYI